ncbi:MAG: hypothetical protein ICV51_16460 [Flavisolibacter sp.]|nr:hypothetical protein [Flavisolibacter sp.]
MKWFLFLFLALMMLITGCDFRKRELDIQKKETELSQREQELLLREQTLALKEEELTKREQRLDSTALNDTALVYNAALEGLWSVKMTCIETTCPGSAVGDTKTEQWSIAYQNNLLVAKAMTGDKVVRIYSGTNKETALELTESRDSTSSQPATTIVVRLTMTGPITMEGQREIIRKGDCKIVYSVQMTKQ